MFKAFKCNKNAFYSSVVVTHSSQAPIFDILFFNPTSDIVKGPCYTLMYDSLLYIKKKCILNFCHCFSYKFISLT